MYMHLSYDLLQFHMTNVLIILCFKITFMWFENIYGIGNYMYMFYIYIHMTISLSHCVKYDKFVTFCHKTSTWQVACDTRD